MRNLGKLFLASILCIAVGAFTSCSDNDGFFADIEYPAEYKGDAIVAEAWASDYSFEIKTSGQWKIVTDDRFFSVTPDHGTGDAVVKISVENNQGDERKVGAFDVQFPGNESYNKTILVEQKWEGDYDENAADKITTSNKIYAIGYSYDATGEWASPNSVKMEIFNTHKLNQEGKHVVGPTQASLQESTITGSSISDMTNALAVKANVSGGFGKFKAEANASFDMNHAKNSNYEYAITYFNLDVRAASFDTDFRTLCDDYMTDDAWYAINGVPRENKRTHKMKVSYPSTEEGFKALVKSYGTHVVMTAKLGGRVRHSMEVDISKITSSYDVGAFAKASYDGTFASGGGSVDEKFKQSYEDNKKNVTIRLNVLGGNESLAKTLGSSDGFTASNLNSWVQSVTADNMALVGFDGNSLIPLYELIDESLTLEEDGVDGKARKQALMKYMNGEQISKDFSSYDCGTVVEIDVPSFNHNDPNSSLIKDVMIDGQYVGQICEEYIPNLNLNARVTVVYPVINNTPRYNMGFFLGNSSHKPARVSWDGTNVTLQEYTDLDFGKVSKIYLRGASVSAGKTEDVVAKPGTVTNSCLSYLDVDYPLVKIFDKIWMRSDFQPTQMNTGWPPLGVEDRAHYNGTNKDYYSFKIAGEPNLAPKGWHVAKSSEYKAIQNKLEANGITEIGKSFLSDGVLGYNAQFDGWLAWKSSNSGKYWEYVSAGGVQTEYVTSDYYHVRIRKDGIFAIDFGGRDSPWMMSIRCVKD